MGILSSSVDVDANFHDKVVVSIKDSSIVQLGVAVCSAEKTSMATIDPTDVIIMPRIDNSYKVVIENLNPNTTYNLFFRNICDSANNVITEWTDEPISVTTLCEPVEVVGDSLIFFDGFEAHSGMTTRPFPSVAAAIAILFLDMPRSPFPPFVTLSALSTET